MSVPPRRALYPLLFLRAPDAKTIKDRWHFDLAPEDQDAEATGLWSWAPGGPTSGRATRAGS